MILLRNNAVKNRCSSAFAQLRRDKQPPVQNRLTDSHHASFYFIRLRLWNRLRFGRRDLQPARFIKEP